MTEPGAEDGTLIGVTMTYRQWLAGQAMAGLLATSRTIKVDGSDDLNPTTIALAAVRCSDALIAELKKEAR